MNTRLLDPRAWTLAGALLVLLGLNWAWAGKARIVAEGQQVFISLAPLDPRSLMQGDYMDLRFGLSQAIASRFSEELRADDLRTAAFDGDFGRAPITVDARGVAELAWDDAAPVLSIRYRRRQGRVWLGTSAFFFEEGKARRYEQARFGVFKLDPASGEAVLVGLADDQLKLL